MSSRQIRNLQDRINNLGGVGINKNRSLHSRYFHRGVDIIENWAWRFFVEMQLTSLEVAEVRSGEKRRKELGYASCVRGHTPEEEAQDRNLYDRDIAIMESAELRAEEILEHDPTQWHSWLSYFQSTVWPAFQGPIEEEVHNDETIEHIWDFKLRYWDAWKAKEPEP